MDRLDEFMQYGPVGIDERMSTARHGRAATVLPTAPRNAQIKGMPREKYQEFYKQLSDSGIENYICTELKGQCAIWFTLLNGELYVICYSAIDTVVLPFGLYSFDLSEAITVVSIKDVMNFLKIDKINARILVGGIDGQVQKLCLKAHGFVETEESNSLVYEQKGNV